MELKMKGKLNKTQIISITAVLLGVTTIGFLAKYFTSDAILSKQNGLSLISNSDKEKVTAIFNTRFPKATIENISTGPANTWVINAKVGSDAKQFYLLSDRSHVVEGKMTSLFDQNYAVEINPAPAIDEQARLRNEFLAKLQNKRDAVDVGADAEVKDTKTVKPNNNTHPFKLPELNSVLTTDDKNKFYNLTKELEYIEVGNESAPLIHVYFDFNCPGCRQAKKVLKKFTDKGELRVRYIPVGVITEESSIKAAYTLIPSKNEDRNVLLEYFVQPGTAGELIKSKAPKSEVLRALGYVNNANKVFMFTPKKLTPTFTFELNGEVVIANLTSEKGIQNLVDRMKK